MTEMIVIEMTVSSRNS